VHGGVTSRHDNASFTTDYSSVAVGYTQYDVFGTHAFVSLNLRQPFGTAEAGALSPQVVVGIPLTTNQTLTLDYEQTRFRNRTELVGGRYEVDRQDAERLMSLTWTYNTTNQPFVPTRGTLVRVAPLWSARDRALYTWNQIVSYETAPEDYAQHTNGKGLDVLASRYWELSDRDAVAATFQGGWAVVHDRANQVLVPTSVTSHPSYFIVGGSYSYNLWAGKQRNGDSRIEGDLAYVARRRGFDRQGAYTYFDNQEGIRTFVSWVRRTSWGTSRLGLGYTWNR
jgi:outer membrane protein assembly factor BamA